MWNKLIDVSIDRCGFTRVPVATVGRTVVIHIMLVSDISKETYFTLWQKTSKRWLCAPAHLQRVHRRTLHLCQASRNTSRLLYHDKNPCHRSRNWKKNSQLLYSPPLCESISQLGSASGCINCVFAAIKVLVRDHSDGNDWAPSKMLMLNPYLGLLFRVKWKTS